MSTSAAGRVESGTVVVRNFVWIDRQLEGKKYWRAVSSKYFFDDSQSLGTYSSEVEVGFTALAFGGQFSYFSQPRGAPTIFRLM